MQRDRTVGAGHTVVVTDSAGRTDGDVDHAGAYCRDTRHLDRYDLDGDVEFIDSVAPRPGERVSHLGRPADDGARSRHVTRRQFVRPGRLCERVTVSNLTSTPGGETLTLSLGTAFDDLFAVRGYVDDDRTREVVVDTLGRRVDEEETDEDGVRFAYDPSDLDRRWETVVRVAALDGGSAAVEIDTHDGTGRADATVDVTVDLDGHETRPIGVVVDVDGGGEDEGDSNGDVTRGRESTAGVTPETTVTDCLGAVERWVRERAAAWDTETTLVDVPWPDVVERSRRDLLDLRLDSGVFAAGIPWYATVFGRDSIIAAYQALPLSTAPARATCRLLAERQADSVDDYRAAEPGKIMHESRDGELAVRAEVPHTPYYGSVDATPLFVTLVHETWRWTGDDGFLHDLWPHVERALSWCDHREDGEFLTYPTDGHLRHVGWKDSADGVVYPDGEGVAGPVALAEVQGYVYDARRRGAAVARRLGDERRAAELDSACDRLRERFDAAFWLPAEGTYAVALDDGTPVKTVTTNPGHCLWSGIVPERRAGRVIDRLRAADVASGWGLRTLASSHAAYNPQSYHRGSVWPHDTALCALGMRRYGDETAARDTVDELVAAARAADGRLPELFAGFARSETEIPVEYGSACEPQAWAAGAPVACLRAVDAVDGPGLDDY
jgi:glycogen debranching enzyme